MIVKEVLAEEYSGEVRVIFKDRLKEEHFRRIKAIIEAWGLLCLSKAFGDDHMHEMSDAVMDDDVDEGNVVIFQMDWASLSEENLQYLWNALDHTCDIYGLEDTRIEILVSDLLE